MPAMIDTSSHEAAIKYWETFLQNFKPCHFPALIEGLPTLQDNFQETTVELDAHSLAIQEFCFQHHVTLGSLFRTAWAIVIGCYAGVEDVSFGYSSDNGTLPTDGEFESIFICRTQITAENLLSQTMVEVMRNFENALAHRDCSFSEIQKRLGIEEQSLFNSGLHIQSVGVLDVDGSLTFGQGMKNVDLTEYDILARILIRDDGSLAVSIRTRTSKFSASQTLNVAHTLGKTLVECIRAHPQSTIGDLDIFSQRDYEQVMSWNKTFPRAVDTCFDQLFEDIAQKMPDASAICSWDRNFTYRELDALSTKLANYLVDLGAGPETLVLICFDKCSTAIVSMLGIFKAGGAFVAMDPSYPASRVQAIAKATNASIVIAKPAHCHLFEGIVEHIVSIDHKSADELPLALTVVRPQPSPSNTAYVVFTSGSTGAPKGTMVEHRALCTAASSLATPMRVNATTRFLQFAAYTFDLSYGDIFVTLSQGGCICVPSEHERVNDLAGAIVRMNVNTACLIPSVARIFQPEDVPCLKTLLLGGEALLQESLELWAAKVDLVQLYGPSEATVWCTAQSELKANSPANNIGRGLAALLWITSLTSHERLCPVGCIGELLIEGPVLARGYLDAQQTKLSFVENPSWAKVEPGQRRRFYKTGDLVRYDTDGSMRFIGRKDTQVKFHGRRIEMGEIEYHLSSHELLRQAVVILPTNGIYSQRLVAIVVLKTSRPLKHSVGELKPLTGISKQTSTSELAKVKDFLSLRVPSYMLPQFWVAVEEIPLMVSGKMNRVLAKRFVESLTEERSEEMVNRENTNQDLTSPMEIRLRDIWSRVINKDATDVGVESSFFSLGGDSFSAMELVAACKAEGLALTVQDVLSSTTIRQMASSFEMRIAHNVPEASQVQDYSPIHKVLKFAPIWWDTRPALVSSVRAWSVPV